MDRPLNLETSRCSRTTSAGGTLTELVRLNGIRGNLSKRGARTFRPQVPGAESGRREMKAIFRRLRRLEERTPKPAVESLRAAEVVRERRHGRLEAAGQPYDKLQWATAK